MSLIFATQLTALATLALAVLALVAGLLAGLALRRQTQEVTLLLEQNKRDTDERRRAQAAHVFLAAPRDDMSLVRPYAQNASDLPVYNATIRYGSPDGGLSEPDQLGMIMPGQIAYAARQFPAGEALRLTSLTFRDAAGVGWVRMPDGDLWAQGSLNVRDSDLVSLRIAVAMHSRGPRDDFEDQESIASIRSLLEDVNAGSGRGFRLRHLVGAIRAKRRAREYKD